MGSLVLGWIVFIVWSGPRPSSSGLYMEHARISSWQLNLLFLGDLTTESQWYADWSAKTGAEKQPLTAYLFSLVTVLWSTLILVRFTKEWEKALEDEQLRNYDA
jgi:hypothetical protein